MTEQQQPPPRQVYDLEFIGPVERAIQQSRFLRVVARIYLVCNIIGWGALGLALAALFLGMIVGMLFL